MQKVLAEVKRQDKTKDKAQVKTSGRDHEQQHLAAPSVGQQRDPTDIRIRDVISFFLSSCPIPSFAKQWRVNRYNRHGYEAESLISYAPPIMRKGSRHMHTRMHFVIVLSNLCKRAWVGLIKAIRNASLLRRHSAYGR